MLINGKYRNYTKINITPETRLLLEDVQRVMAAEGYAFPVTCDNAVEYLCQLRLKEEKK